jgi:A/G-specific adenine glycosylase
MELTPVQIRAFRTHIFNWWKSHRRDLPWRHTDDPYKILISEVMLQQTQVSRVLPVFQAFITQFPSVTDLSRASVADVLRAWKGMGYNRRALFLQKAARVITGTYHGKFPNEENLLLELPGIGLYTARAVMVFAFRLDVAMVDTNIRQIITEEFYDGVPQSPKTVQSVADQLVPPGKSWEWHQALMDYGALELVRTTKNVPETGQKKKTPFRETARFLRGRIIDELRDGELPLSQFIETLSRKYGKPADVIARHINILGEEGMVRVSPDGAVRLSD